MTEMSKEPENVLRTRKFLHFVNNQAYHMIQRDIDRDNVQPIKISFYGKELEIDTHADNYSELLMFLEKVIKNDLE